MINQRIEWGRLFSDKAIYTDEVGFVQPITFSSCQVSESIPKTTNSWWRDQVPNHSVNPDSKGNSPSMA